MRRFAPLDVLHLMRTNVERSGGPAKAARPEEDCRMARYRFHCTNGSECFFDARGTDIRVPARLAIRAQQVAREVMRTRVEAADWSDWRVAVCDLKGRRVLVQPFGQTVKTGQP